MYRNRRRWQMGHRSTGISFIDFARVMLAALEGGHDATSGKLFLPREKRCRQVTSTTR
ncbi:hypothetical protein ACNKHV_04770 [Shigella flexneri]